MVSPADGPAGEAFTQARGVIELAWLIAAAAAGETLRQAARRADEAERTREKTARLRAPRERLHIAWEPRDRVTALGGRLRAEPRTQGGFTVQAELPVARIS